MKLIASIGPGVTHMNVYRPRGNRPRYRIRARREIADYLRRDLAGLWLSVGELKRALRETGLVLEKVTTRRK